MIDWLHQLPALLAAAVVIGCFLLPALIGSVVLQPMVGRLLRKEKDPNALAALLLGSFSVYYGVLLALLSIAVFENFSKAQDAVGREASSIVALYQFANAYPEPLRTSLTNLVRHYAEVESGPGWEEQRRGRASRAGTIAVDDISDHLLRFKPDRDSGEDVLHGETLRVYSIFLDHRSSRIEAAASSIHPIVWYVVLIGAVLNVFVLWLFELERSSHLILSGVLMVFIGLSIFMVAVLDEPFRGAHGLGPDDLIEARQRIGSK